MILRDMNQSWKAPVGYLVTGLHAEGAFLVVQYEHRDTQFGKTIMEYVNVYLNDQGREVARTEDSNSFLEMPEPTKGSGGEKTVSWWESVMRILMGA